MFKKIIGFLLLAGFAVSLCGCMFGGGDDTSDGTGGKKPSGSLPSGKWPASVYDQYGIDQISTSGKIVYTNLPGEGSYQYEVYYSGVTREELVAWTNGLFEKGFRASDRDKERLTDATYFYDIMIYSKEEKQPYRMRISFDFGEGMEFEYYAYYDEPDPNFTVVEKEDDYGETHAYIEYDLCVSLNPMKTEEEYEGEFPSLGLKAEDLKGVNGVRRIGMGEAAYMSSINFNFYSDHVTTEEEAEQCRTLLIDKLAEKGAKFYDALDQNKELSAAELKESGKGGYYVENNGNRFLLMVNPDSSVGDFGSSYGLVLTKIQK